MEPPRPKKLLDQVRDALRLKHYSYRTEQTYIDWIRRYILFHNKRHPQEMGTAEVTQFLTHLAVQEQVEATALPRIYGKTATTFGRCKSCWATKMSKPR
jgi:hypothetical protein